MAETSRATKRTPFVLAMAGCLLIGASFALYENAVRRSLPGMYYNNIFIWIESATKKVHESHGDLPELPISYVLRSTVVRHIAFKMFSCTTENYRHGVRRKSITNFAGSQDMDWL